MGFELEPFDDILSDVVTKNSNEDGEGSLCLSEVPALLAVNIKDAEENFGSRACDSVGFSACWTCDAAEPCACPDSHLTQDTVTRKEAAVSNKDGDIQIDNGRSEIEEANVFPGTEGLDFMPDGNISSGLHAGKFRPKPKMKTRRERPSIDISHPEVVSTMHLQAPELVPSGAGFIDEGSVPALPADLTQDYFMRFDGFITSEPTSEIPMDEELRNVAETSHPDGPVLGDILHSEDVPEIPVEADVKARKGEDESGKSSRQLRKRVAFQIIDELLIEANEHGGFSAEPPFSNSNMDEGEDEEEDEEYRAQSTSQNKKGPRKSKKPEAEQGKPVRKRKKANEAADQSTQKPPKKFDHSTRQSRRRVDKALLETPEDDIDPQKLPIKDLILLAEYKERLVSKEAATSKTSSTNLRSHKSFNEESSYTGEETFASEQGRGSDDDQPSYPLINYQSFMVKTPSTRWSKQDTELFYEAVSQFGTDFAMIQQLFPGRTRHQVKLKFKKEEHQYPLRLSEALTSRAKDHSHFHMVIEQLQQASRAEQNSNIDDMAGVTGEEEVEEVTAQTKEEVAKPEQDQEVVVKDQEEVDFVDVHSPVKSDASEGDVYDWSQYKSDY
ncbi:Transcription factor TFIIIB component B'' [Morella rubra]|uniref:Transcription factor TFIIIB component B n=1 Tax=Morella rubra TaxID=262757 RepID=A0A6A1VIB5_9ROSI|nr:Transcription factor TFIIIB component B'' [Morella rubra]